MPNNLRYVLLWHLVQLLRELDAGFEGIAAIRVVVAELAEAIQLVAEVDAGTTGLEQVGVLEDDLDDANVVLQSFLGQFDIEFVFGHAERDGVLGDLEEGCEALCLQERQNRVLTLMSKQLKEILEIQFADFVGEVRQRPNNLQLVNVIYWNDLDEFLGAFRAKRRHWLIVQRHDNLFVFDLFEFRSHHILQHFYGLVAAYAEGHDVGGVPLLVVIQHRLPCLWFGKALLVPKNEPFQWTPRLRHLHVQVRVVPKVTEHCFFELMVDRFDDPR